MLHALKSRRARVFYVILAMALLPMIAGLHAAASAYEDVDIFSAFVSAPTPTRVALVIGNADYPDANAPLTGSIRDARSLATCLRGRGFDVDLEENLDKAGMDRAVAAFLGKAAPGVTALVSFGGFGIQVARENYLIPTDAQIWREADVIRTGLSVNDLLAKIAAKGGEATIAILDASRRNPFERRFRAVSAGLAAVDAPRDTLVLSSMTPNKAIGEDGPARDIAVGVLIEQMKGATTDVETLFNTTRHRVSIATKGEQVPLVSSSLLSTVAF